MGGAACPRAPVPPPPRAHRNLTCPARRMEEERRVFVPVGKEATPPPRTANKNPLKERAFHLDKEPSEMSFAKATSIICRVLAYGGAVAYIIFNFIK